MRKSILIISLSIAFLFHQQDLYAQACGTRQLDLRIASFLKLIAYEDLSIEQLRALPIQQIKMGAAPPIVPFPQEDVKRIKITKDSIPVLVFNPCMSKICRS